MQLQLLIGMPLAGKVYVRWSPSTTKTMSSESWGPLVKHDAAFLRHHHYIEMYLPQ